MIKVGITGQVGFIGMHLFNTLGLHKELFERVPFEDDYFSCGEALSHFVKQCDVIVHLAAMNRHNDAAVLYETNIRLVKQLVSACEESGSKPHILFSSSTQEELDNLYGKSKRKGREILEDWAAKNSTAFTGLIIPNVYGPFGHPYYNSVVATFCHQLTHNETPQIETDSEVKLIYVGELVKVIIDNILKKHGKRKSCENVRVPPTASVKVSYLLKKLSGFKEDYYEKGIIPDLSVAFDRNLFNTLLCYIDHASFFPFHYEQHTDERGSFAEIIKLNSGGQVSFSTTMPGVTRGNHFHTRKSERFAVIRGSARIEIRRIGTENVHGFDFVSGKPGFIDMPVWFTHNITNTGDEELVTVFWTNEHFDPDDPDTFYEEV